MLLVIIWLVICLIGVLRWSEGYFPLYNGEASNMVGGNKSMPKENPRPSADCWQAFSRTLRQEAELCPTWTHKLVG